MLTPPSDHSWRELSIASSTSGNFEGLEREKINYVTRDGGGESGTYVSLTDHIRPLHLYSATCPSP